MIGQFAKFVFFGAVNTLVGLSVIFLALRFLDAGALPANAAGYLAGFMVSFVLNGRITFGQESLSASMFGRFAAVYAIAYLANVVTLWLALSSGKYLAEAAGVAAYTLIGFLGCRLFVFRAA
ncbi:MAG: GtrA family protein [Rhodospirillales bacterium]|nr:GtrA family protein [Rhodospirillales bacterium]